MSSSRWIPLAGAANVRDLGGLPTVDGRSVQPDRLIRSDNLQGLTDSDVRTLVDGHGVRAVADLRTGVELDLEGPGPMTREASVDVAHFSLFPEAGRNTDAGALDDSARDDGARDSDRARDDTARDNTARDDTARDDRAPVVLPWQNRGTDLGESDGARKGAAWVYLRYLNDRADSVIGALRLIAGTDGATIVHCAAGKDRTGVVVALALAEVGVTRDAIVDDYAQSAERIEAIFARLRASRTYSADLENQSIDRHRPRAGTMEHLLDALDADHGGPSAWLRSHGWTDDDTAALRKRLLDEIPSRRAPG